MIRELREVRDNLSLYHYLSYLMGKGKIKKYVSKNGYCCYDTEEYEEYKRHTRRGRPVKNGLRRDE